jgi:hypothetical protein
MPRSVGNITSSGIVYPMFRSSKVMRRALKALISQEELGGLYIDLGNPHLPLHLIKPRFPHRTVDSPAASFVPGRPFKNNPPSNQMVDLATSWYNKCLKDHTTYGIDATEALLPARVIDVGLRGDCKTDPLLYLCSASRKFWAIHRFKLLLGASHFLYDLLENLYHNSLSMEFPLWKCPQPSVTRFN